MEAGVAERAGFISPYGMHDSEARRERLPAQRLKALDPVRKCAKTQIAARSAENKTLVCLLGGGLGDGGGSLLPFLPFQPSPRGERGPEPLPGGGPVSRKPQTLIFAAA